MLLQRLLKTMQVTFRLELFLQLNIMMFVKIRICINIRSLNIISEIELMELTNLSTSTKFDVSSSQVRTYIANPIDLKPERTSIV